MSFVEIWAAVIIGLGLVLSSKWWLPRWRALRGKLRLACRCGHLPPPPTEGAIRVMRIIARGLVWLQVGKIEVSGRENLECDSPKLIAPTHGHYLDPFVIALLLRDRPRCMAARGLLRFGGGLGALFLSPCGAFCVDLDSGKGIPAFHSAIRVLSSGQTLVMFPEGWAHMDGVVGPFKRGAVSIARMAAARLGRPLSIVPVYLRYGAYPGRWINKLPPPLQYLIVFLGLVCFRRGVRVVVGKPLLSSELPERATLATRELRKALLALDPQGRQGPP